MSEWKPISEAPKDGTQVLLFGSVTGGGEVIFPRRSIILSGYWDSTDAAWCSTTADWTGPFVDARLWMPLPSPPERTEDEPA